MAIAIIHTHVPSKSKQLWCSCVFIKQCLLVQIGDRNRTPKPNPNSENPECLKLWISRKEIKRGIRKLGQYREFRKYRNIYRLVEFSQWIPILLNLLDSIYVVDLFVSSFIYSFFYCHLMYYICLRCVFIDLHTHTHSQILSQWLLPIMSHYYVVLLVVCIHSLIKCELPCSFVFMTDYLINDFFLFIRIYARSFLASYA